MKRTPEQISQRITDVVASGDDWMGTQINDLICALPFEAAIPFLTPEKIEEARADWEQSAGPDPRAAILGYLEFAWSKANNCRGLSAGRSLDHFKAWMFLDGIEPADLEFMTNYNLYGKPQLVTISELYGYDWAAQDDGKWRVSDTHQGIGAEYRDDKIKVAKLLAQTLAERYGIGAAA